MADQRLDSFIHMQYSGATGGVAQPARWEAAVQNGIYDVTVAVGDVGTVTGSRHRLTVESVNLVNNFTPARPTRSPPSRPASRSPTARSPSTRPVAPTPSSTTSTSFPCRERAGRRGHPGPHQLRARRRAGPHRYTNDTGAAYTPTRYGWISQADATPLDITGNGRDRNQLPDQRLDTFMHMQFTGTSAASPARWHTRPMGTYDVTVSVGDSGAPGGHSDWPSRRRGGEQLRPDRQRQVPGATVRASVSDGFLTLDATGGTNTKINYVEIVDADNTPRTITGVDPGNNATNVPLDASISLSPSHAVEQTTVASNTVKLLAPGGAQVAGSYNSDAAGGVVIFTPTEHLAPNTAHRRDHDGPPGHGGQPVRSLQLVVHHRHELDPSGAGQLRPHHPGGSHRPHLDRHRTRRQALRRQRHR